MNNPSKWVTPFHVTVLRAEGLHVVIYLNDHLPAHVHVFGDGEAKINLVGEGAPILVWVEKMTRGEGRRSIRLGAEQRLSLLQRWVNIRG